AKSLAGSHSQTLPFELVERESDCRDEEVIRPRRQLSEGVFTRPRGRSVVGKACSRFLNLNGYAWSHAAVRVGNHSGNCSETAGLRERKYRQEVECACQPNHSSSIATSAPPSTPHAKREWVSYSLSKLGLISIASFRGYYRYKMMQSRLRFRPAEDAQRGSRV